MLISFNGGIKVNMQLNDLLRVHRYTLFHAEYIAAAFPATLRYAIYKLCKITRVKGRALRGVTQTRGRIMLSRNHQVACSSRIAV